MEIERKYTVKEIPNHLEQYQCINIVQGYLCNNPIIRIRKSNEEYILTYKSKQERKNENSPIMNHEVELPLTKEAFDRLFDKIDFNPVKKRRYIIPLEGGLKAELDIFEERLQGLILVEVEFPDEIAANKFIAPNWFLEDVCRDKRFSNYFLSQVMNIDELNL